MTSKPKYRAETGVDPKVAALAEASLAKVEGATDDDVTDLAEALQSFIEETLEALEDRRRFELQMRR